MLRYRETAIFLKGHGVASRLDMSLANDVQEVGRVIDNLEEFGAGEGIGPGQSLRFGLAVGGLISYGLAGRSDGIITLSIEYADGALRAELADNGPPFDPLAAETAKPGGAVEERAVGGLGITLVKTVMDRLDYRRDGGFNRVNMEMKLKAA